MQLSIYWRFRPKKKVYIEDDQNSEVTVRGKILKSEEEYIKGFDFTGAGDRKWSHYIYACMNAMDEWGWPLC